MAVDPQLTLWRLRARSHLMTQLRQFFYSAGFTEVDTPIAIGAPAPEVAIEAIEVHICADDFALGPAKAQRRFLQTSPELAMKRLLAQGLHPIFQVAAVFRDGDHSQMHAPEFRLLEWYRAHAPYGQLMDDCEQLISTLVNAAQALPGPFARADVACHQGTPQLWRAPPPWPRLTVEACFRTYAGFSILEANSVVELRHRLDAAGMHHAPEDSWNDLFYRVFVTCIEPALSVMPSPVFVTEFPAQEAALARLSPHDPRVAERFELYGYGMELANAFGELTDSTQQRQRFDKARQERRTMGRRDYPLDETFLAALDAMPPASGIALGIERLMMLLLGAPHINDVSFIPWDTA